MITLFAIVDNKNELNQVYFLLCVKLLRYRFFVCFEPIISHEFRLF